MTFIIITMDLDKRLFLPLAAQGEVVMNPCYESGQPEYGSAGGLHVRAGELRELLWRAHLEPPA